MSGSNPFGDLKFTDRNWRVLDTLRSLADEIGRAPAQVALAWAWSRPGISSVLIGASRPEQLADNIASLDVRLDADQSVRLNAASAPEPVYPYPIFSPEVNRIVFGGESVAAWQGW